MQNFHEIRKTGLGGSDIAILAGLSSYKTPYELYLEKIGESTPTPETPEQYWGKILEPVIAAEYARRTGSTVRIVKKTLRDKKQKYLIGHIDRKIDGTRKILECKTARFADRDSWGSVDSDKIPPAYMLQVQHYLEIGGFEEADLALLASTSDFRIYTIKYDHEIGKLIRKLAKEFWERIEKRTPPPPINLTDARRAWPHDNGETVIASPEISDTVTRLREVKAEIKKLELEEGDLEAAIANELQDRAYLLDADGNELASFKKQTSRRIDTDRLKKEAAEIYEQFSKVTETRVLRIKK